MKDREIYLSIITLKLKFYEIMPIVIDNLREEVF